jgi:pyrrolidone-carboxylate peptidase
VCYKSYIVGLFNNGTISVQLWSVHIHLPALPAPGTATVPAPSMSLELMEEAIRTAVAVAVQHDGPDLSPVAGAVS